MPSPTTSPGIQHRTAQSGMWYTSRKAPCVATPIDAGTVDQHAQLHHASAPRHPRRAHCMHAPCADRPVPRAERGEHLLPRALPNQHLHATRSRQRQDSAQPHSPPAALAASRTRASAPCASRQRLLAPALSINQCAEPASHQHQPIRGGRPKADHHSHSKPLPASSSTLSYTSRPHRNVRADARTPRKAPRLRPQHRLGRAGP
mmetsp:Transcript_29555/g.80859  ORF Transcript_29555/g.80859 Transcript_29555/m.80859 type:complete len:204 (+) Transcript_29555:253-864(+)